MFEDIKKLKALPIKLTEAQVAKYLNIDTRTVKKYWNMEEKEYLKLLKEDIERKQESVLDKYADEIIDWLKKFRFLSAAQIYDRLKENYPEFNASNSLVRKYVAKIKEKYNLNRITRVREYVAVPELPMGKQAQVDFGEIILKDIDGNNVKLWVFLIVLSHSRYKFGIWQEKPFNAEDFVNAHEKAFKFFGGIPEEIVYDRTKTALIAENDDGTFKLSKPFQKFVDKSHFKPMFSRPYDPENKGKIEAVVKFVKNNFARYRTFKNIDSFNNSFYKWLERTGNGKIHEITKKVPAEVFSLEKQYLATRYLTKDTPIIQHRVKKDNTISYNGNKYSLPKGTYTDHKTVVLDIKDNILKIRTLDLELIVSYNIPKEKGKLLQKEPYHRNIDKSVAELREEYLKKFESNERISEYLKNLMKLSPKAIRRNLEKFTAIEKEHNLKTLLTAIDYAFAKNDFTITTLKLKAEQFSLKESEISRENRYSQKNNISQYYEVKVRSINEYQNIQNEQVK